MIRPRSAGVTVEEAASQLLSRGIENARFLYRLCALMGKWHKHRLKGRTVPNSDKDLLPFSVARSGSLATGRELIATPHFHSSSCECAPLLELTPSRMNRLANRGIGSQ